MIILRQGDQGADVGELQQALLEYGYDLPVAETSKKLFGPMTFVAVRSFQARHIGPDGHALTEDGIVGPATQWAMDHQTGPGLRYTATGWRPQAANSNLERVISWAIGQIGTIETPPGSNRGPRIDVWTGMEGASPEERGPPWCGYFCSYAYKQMDFGSPFGTLASAYKFKAWGEQYNRILSPVQEVAPMPGDVFVIIRGDYHGHVGIIVGQLPNGTVTTCEGNSGQAVRGLIRSRDQFACIIRPVPL